MRLAHCILLGLALVTGSITPPALAAAPKPNIIFILADDLGINDLSCYGSHIPTPGIDRLAVNGMKLPQFYAASSICTPTRFGLLTGRYPARSQDKLLGALMFALKRDDDRGIRPGEVTIAEVLRNAGYHTALIGKWHLGHGQPEFSPLKHGFDYFYGMNGGCVDYFTLKYGNMPDWVRNGEPLQENGYSTNLLSDDALRYLDSRPVDRPFFLYLSYTAPHYGKGWDEDRKEFTNILQAKPEDLEEFAGIEDKNRREYAAMVRAMDRGVGRILDKLSALRLEENTLVIFSSDNGGDPAYGGNNEPFRGKKAEVFEGGIRVPCLIQWKGKVGAGTYSRQPVSTLDFFPTFCALAGIPVSGLALDGIDITPVLLRGKTFERELCWTVPRASAFLRGQWKYIRTGGTEMLFDLEADPWERRDMADRAPNRVKEMREAYDKIAASFNAGRNPAVRPGQ
jgi:arylsulfatase A-like enzyme